MTRSCTSSTSGPERHLVITAVTVTDVNEAVRIATGVTALP